jgi:hypothetical protein
MTGKYFQALSRIPYSALSGKESGELYGKRGKKEKKIHCSVGQCIFGKISGIWIIVFGRYDRIFSKDIRLAELMLYGRFILNLSRKLDMIA